LTRIAKLVRADAPIHLVGRGLAKRTMVGLSVAVVSFGASAWPVAGSAGADQITSTQAQLRSLQQRVVASASRIHTLTLSYEQATTQADALAQQVAADQADMARIRREVATTATELRNDAILSYTGGTTSTPSGLGASDDPAIRDEYLQVAAGNLSDTMDQYETQMGAEASAASALATEMKASQAAVRAAAQARGQALAQAATAQNQLDVVQGRLERLEAAQLAAQAAAREEAAQAQARAQQARVLTHAPVPASAPSPSQGLPVNDGLVSVVKNVVAPSPPPPSGGNAGGVWLQLRQCESGDNYQENSGNGFYGAYQFSQTTWANLGFPGRADQEPPAMQDQAAQKLQAEAGWGQWPACAAALGLT
jgi:hypothetical protein